MLDLLALTLGFFGLLSMPKGWHIDTPVYGEGPLLGRPSSPVSAAS